MPVAEKLDPFTAYLPYRLYRESTRYVDGKVVKVCPSIALVVARPHGALVLLGGGPQG